MNRKLAGVLAMMAFAATSCMLRPTDQTRFCNQAGPLTSAMSLVRERAEASLLMPGDARASVTGIREAMGEVGPLLVSMRADGQLETASALNALVAAVEGLPDGAGPTQVRDALLGPLTDLQTRFNGIASAVCERR